MKDQPTPETDALLKSCKTQDIIDHARNLERERDEAKEQCKYWKGVVRGARAELSTMERITTEEYAALCADTECRDYVDQMDALKHQRDELLAALEDGVVALNELRDYYTSRTGMPANRATKAVTRAESAIAAVKGPK